MKNLILIALLLSVFISMLESCQNGYSSVYSIKKEDSIYIKRHTNTDGTISVMPPKVKYGMYTFIIDANNKFYFYSFPQKKKHEWNGVDDDPEPDSIDLKTNQVSAIPRGTEKDFFDKHVLHDEGPLKFVMVASFKDSVGRDFIEYLKKSLSDTSLRSDLRVRLALPEEREAVRSLNFKRGKFIG